MRSKLLVGQSDGAGNWSAIVAADRAFPVAISDALMFEGGA